MVALNKPRASPPKPRLNGTIAECVTPNSIVSPAAAKVLVLGWVGFFLLYWTQLTSPIIPRPLEVLRALNYLWRQMGLGQELIVSYRVNIEALALASVVSLALAYLHRIPATRFPVEVIRRLRFLGFTGLTLIFVLIFGGGHQLKVGILTVGIGLFLTDAATDIVIQTPADKLDHARTLRNNEWQVLWKVIVRGRLNMMFDAVRQNAAMSWVLITLVEGVVRSEGGVGSLLLTQNRTFRIDEILAVGTTIVVVGLVQDILIGRLKMFVCPHTRGV